MHPEDLRRVVMTVSHEINSATDSIGVTRRIWQEDVSLTYPMPSLDDTYKPEGSKKVEVLPIPSFPPCIVLPANVLTEPFIIIVLTGTPVRVRVSDLVLLLI